MQHDALKALKIGGAKVIFHQINTFFDVLQENKVISK
jgi:hypothetical protein